MQKRDNKRHNYQHENEQTTRRTRGHMAWEISQRSFLFLLDRPAVLALEDRLNVVGRRESRRLIVSGIDVPSRPLQSCSNDATHFVKQPQATNQPIHHEFWQCQNILHCMIPSIFATNLRRLCSEYLWEVRNAMYLKIPRTCYISAWRPIEHKLRDQQHAGCSARIPKSSAQWQKKCIAALKYYRQLLWAVSICTYHQKIAAAHQKSGWC